MGYLTFARSYRPLGTDIASAVNAFETEVPASDRDFEPERSDLIELGGKMDLMDGRVGLTAAVFQIKKRNSYDVDPVTGDITPGFSANGENRRIRGFELGASGEVAEGVDLLLAYANLDSEITGGRGVDEENLGNDAPGVPRHNLALWGSHERPVTRTGGAVTLDGSVLAVRGPEDALAAGIAYLTEDRKGLGLFLDLSCGTNINLGVIARDAGAGGVLDLAAARRRAAGAFQALRVRAASPQVAVGSLSGGNQQKVLLSRWLETGPRVLILDEPTRGVDIGAKSEIYRIIDDLARRGIGVIVISSELPEIIGTCDRVLVMREGRLVGEVGGAGGAPITQENIMAYGAGAATAA